MVESGTVAGLESHMMHLDITMADSRVIANYDAPDGGGFWTVRVIDLLSGGLAELKLTNSEMAALAALMIGGDDTISSDMMYNAIGQKVQHLPVNLRPIP